MGGPNQKMRILLVMNGLGWAGAETQLIHLAIGLVENGHDVEILAIGPITIDLEPLHAAGVKTTALYASSRGGKVRSVGTIFRHARRADVVHCTGWDATLWGRLGALLARRPVLITEHTPGRELQVSRSGGRRVRLIALHNRILGRFTAASIVVAQWQVELLEDEGVSSASIVHIPNAVPVAELRRQSTEGPSRESLAIPAGAKVVAHVARFSPQKGQAITVRALGRLRDELGDVRVLFIGEGSEQEAIESAAADLGPDATYFLGRRNDVPGLIALADLAVLPSLGEGLPMSLIEALALGTPVVASDAGDIPWLLDRWRGGVYVDKDDWEAFERACRSILEDPVARERLSQAGYEGAARFDADGMTRRYEMVFEAAIEDGPLPRFDAEFEVDAGMPTPRAA
jgi:glycosyltransferase involved in cell wall biosynthesis